MIRKNRVSAIKGLAAGHVTRDAVARFRLDVLWWKLARMTRKATLSIVINSLNRFVVRVVTRTTP